MKTKILLITLFIVAYISHVQAQDTYFFSVSNEAYTDLSETTSLSNGEVWDDPEYIVPIGFDFSFYGETVNELRFVGLGGIVANVDTVANVFDFITPLFNDIVDRADNTELTEGQSDISYKLEGNVGSHILKIEWKNAGFFDDDTDEDFTNFQLWLYEGSNNIEIHYGASSVVNYDAYEENGLIVGIGNFDVNTELVEESIFLSGPANSPIISSMSNLEELEVYMEGDIPSGTVYRFSTSEPTSLEDWNTLLFTVFPNPAKDIVNIEGEFAKVNILNVTGQFVKQVYAKQIDISDLDAGIYLLELISDNGDKITKKLIKK